MFAKKFAAEEDLKFMTGAGTTEPTGLRTYTVTDTPQAAASLVGDDLIALFYSLPVQYRRNAVWLMHNSIIKLVRQLKSVIDGRYIWTDGLADAPATILGRPVLEQNDIPIDLGTGTDESEIWFGDLSYYLLGDRQTMEVETTTQGAGTFEKHQVAIKLIERIDGQLGLTDAFAKLSAVK
jgi:HK97 family phage major capsid protein